MRSASDLPERRRYLVTLAAGPAIWTIHFFLSYLLPAVWCARVAGRPASLGAVHVTILVATVVALLLIAAIGWNGYQRHRHGGGAAPHDGDTAVDRHRFLGFATFLLAGLSGIATIAVAASVLAFAACRP